MSVKYLSRLRKIIQTFIDPVIVMRQKIRVDDRSREPLDAQRGRERSEIVLWGACVDGNLMSLLSIHTRAIHFLYFFPVD